MDDSARHVGSDPLPRRSRLRWRALATFLTVYLAWAGARLTAGALSPMEADRFDPGMSAADIMKEVLLPWAQHARTDADGR